jgi:hypothetical protein
MNFVNFQIFQVDQLKLFGLIIPVRLSLKLLKSFYENLPKTIENDIEQDQNEDFLHWGCSKIT